MAVKMLSLRVFEAGRKHVQQALVHMDDTNVGLFGV